MLIFLALSSPARLLAEAGASKKAMPAICRAPAAISVTELTLEDMNRAYAKDSVFPTFNKEHVGEMRFDGGGLLRSEDARFSDFDILMGDIPAVHSRAGCWFRWSMIGHPGHASSISGARLSSKPMNPAGDIRRQPEETPSLPDYRFVAADWATNSPYSWIGIWVASDGGNNSEAVAFNGSGDWAVLAQFPYRLGAISTLPHTADSTLDVSLFGMGARHAPVPYILLNWTPGSSRR